MCEIILYKYEIWIGYWWAKMGSWQWTICWIEKWEIYIINVDSFLKSPVVLNNIRLFILYIPRIENGFIPIFPDFHLYFICFVYIIINSYCVQMTSSIFIYYYKDNIYIWDIIIGRWELIEKKNKIKILITYQTHFPFSFCWYIQELTVNI